MTPFDDILATAVARVGGADALAARLPAAKSAEELRAIPDHRYFSQMSLRIFRAGLKHSLVDAKWPHFEEVFAGFDPPRVRAMSDEALEALLQDKRLIRHWGKMKAVRANAAAFCELAEELGGMGAYLAGWPEDGIVALWGDLAKRFSHMGGNSGPAFLRMVGKDSFLLTDFVVRALIRWGAIDGIPRRKSDRARVQEAFNGWAEASGRSLCEISMILALSVD